MIIAYIDVTQGVPDNIMEPAEYVALKKNLMATLSNITNFSALVLPSYVKIEKLDIEKGEGVLQVWKCAECGALVDPKANGKCPYCGGMFVGLSKMQKTDG